MITMHPGEYLLKMYLEDRGITISKAAQEIGISQPTLSRIINGKMNLTPAMALRFEKFSKRSAESWLVMQNAYSLQKERMALSLCAA